MLYNDMSKEQKKSFNKLIWVLGILAVITSTVIINMFSTESKIEKVSRKYFKSARVQTYNDHYLILKASEYITEEERLIGLRNICSEISELELDNAILVVQFYDKSWVEVTRTITIGMSTIYNTDWSNTMSFEEFKNIINY